MAQSKDLAAQKYIDDNEALTTQEKMNKLVDIMLTTFKFIAPVLVGVGVAITVIGFALIKAALAAAGLSVALSGGTLALAIVGGIAATTAAIIGMNALAGMATGGDVVGGNGPVVVGENGPEIVRLRRGNSVTPNSQLNTVTGGNNKETNDLLRQLIAKVDQPAIIKMGDTTINEMGNKTTLNRNYQAEA
jgi:hypothetical protein